MNIKLARKELNGKPEIVSVDSLIKGAKEAGQKIFYFDKDNSHKDIMALADKFEKSGFSIYFREIRYGLDENDYMYEMHVI